MSDLLNLNSGPMTSDALVRASGCSYRQLDYWCRNGVLVPVDGRAQPGQGYQRRWTRKDARVAHVIARLAGMGATIPVLRHVAAMLRALHDSEWVGSVLVDEAGRVTRIDQEPFRARPITAWLIDLGAVSGRYGPASDVA